MAFHLGRLPPLMALWRARILLQDFPGAFEINNALISNGIKRVAICLPHDSGPDPQWIKTNFCLSGLKTHGLVRERSALHDGGASLRGTWRKTPATKWQQHSGDLEHTKQRLAAICGLSIGCICESTSLTGGEWRRLAFRWLRAV
jgi:hypothetical protein